MAGKFLYFAYGSNLLAQRIHISNKSAVRYGMGKLENYRLDFITYSSRWKGASATIVPTPGTDVWGAIWEMNSEDMASLDKQEGVDKNIYFPMQVNIILPDGQITNCRTYQQTATPEPYGKITNLPTDRRPSAAYLNTILKGAAETNLPKEYQEFLNQIPHNGYDGAVAYELNLDVK